jgi:hypothetical protein
MESEFRPEAIAALDEDQRKERLLRLETALARTLENEVSLARFFTRTHMLIDELRAIGHDLWSFDSDGVGFEIWCGDWTRPEIGGPLVITFRAPSSVEVEWRESPREESNAS